MCYTHLSFNSEQAQYKIAIKSGSLHHVMSTTVTNEDPLKHLKQQLKDIDGQLQELKITVSFDRKPIANVIIPNKLFLL